MSTPALATLPFDAEGRPVHAPAFRLRRIFNWFPMGLTYAFLYMGRYNLTVAKNALGSLMTKEDFGVIFAAGTFTYAIAFVFNGPLTDRLGGRLAILAAALGSGVMNLALGFYTRQLLAGTNMDHTDMVWAMGSMYALNMYFQSFAAVAIIKVNAHWFHVRERGGFSGIFGTMISSGIFFAFTINGWILELASKDAAPGTKGSVWWVFWAPGALLLAMFVVELVFLRDRPGQTGHADFDTGEDAAAMDGAVGVLDIIKRVITNPIIFTIAMIEFCTGVLRNGVMHWFPIYAKEVWSLPGHHPLMHGEQNITMLVLALCVVAAGLTLAGSGRARGVGLTVAMLALIPFLTAGWGGVLFAAGVLGANLAGWVSDLFFQSRRAPAAGGLYGLLTLCAAGMLFVLGGAENTVGWVKDPAGALQPGDVITKVADQQVSSWSEATRVFSCVRSACPGDSQWDADRCSCTHRAGVSASDAPVSTGTIAITVMRAGVAVDLVLKDPAAAGRVGDKRALGVAGPKLTLSPWWLGVLVFLLSVCVIGTHGLLSGAASIDFGGRKAAATAVGLIDGCVYLGTGLQSVALGYITSRNWQYWPAFLIPFGMAGFLLCLRIWNARPSQKAAGH